MATQRAAAPAPAAAPSSPRSGSDVIPEYGPVMEEESQAFAGRWQPGDTVDFTSEAFRVGVRITARCLLRSSTSTIRRSG